MLQKSHQFAPVLGSVLQDVYWPECGLLKDGSGCPVEHAAVDPNDTASAMLSLVAVYICRLVGRQHQLRHRVRYQILRDLDEGLLVPDDATV